MQLSWSTDGFVPMCQAPVRAGETELERSELCTCVLGSVVAGETEMGCEGLYLWAAPIGTGETELECEGLYL